MRILVTGGAGYIGSHAARLLSARGHEVWVYDDLSNGHTAAALLYFNAAGASADGVLGEDHKPETHLIPLILQTALGQRPHVEIFGTDYPTPDGTCVRDYVHVEDLAEAHALALEHLKPGIGL